MDVILIWLSETIAECRMGATAYRAMPTKEMIVAKPSFFLLPNWRKATEVNRRQTMTR